jgi:ankyrin repeat protein
MLHLAMDREWREAIRRDDDVALRALAGAGADIDARDEHGQSGLMVAARDGRVHEAGAALDIQGHGAPGFAGKTALDLAVARGDAAMIDALKKGVERP